MVKIQNREVLERIEDDCKLTPTSDPVPDQLGNVVAPVLVCNPPRYVNISVEEYSDTTGTTVIYTTPKDQDFYLTGIFLSYATDINCDNYSVNLRARLKGCASIRLIELRKNNLTKESKFLSRDFSIPLKLEKNQTITMESTFSAGTCAIRGCIQGYTVDKI